MIFNEKNLFETNEEKNYGDLFLDIAIPEHTVKFNTNLGIIIGIVEIIALRLE